MDNDTNLNTNNISQLVSDLVNYDDLTSGLTFDYNNLTSGSYIGDYDIAPIINENSLQLTNQLSDQHNDQLDYCIKETTYPFNLIETVNYHQQPDYIQHHLHSSSSSSDYRPTLEPTTEPTINGDYVNTYDVLTTRTPTLWSQSINCLTTINANSPSSSSSPRPRSNSFSSINSYHHHVNHVNQYNPSTTLTQPPGLIEPSSSIVFNESPPPTTTMVTIDYDNQINHLPTNLLTESINDQPTPSSGYYYYRPFRSVSSGSSSCSTSSSSSSSSSSLVDKGDYLFTIDDGDLSSGSSIASSTTSSSSSSSSSSSRLQRKRSVNDDNRHQFFRNSYHRRSIKSTKKDKLDKMMSEDKRLETENEILREQIRVMEHQFKILQSKITNILIDAAKKSS